jgi:hypothetical protein
MGNTILKSEINIDKQRAMPFRLAVDLCENIHLHYRDIRLDFSLREWKTFVDFIANVSEVIQKEHSDYNGTDPNYFFQSGVKIPAQSDFYPGRFRVELQGPPFEGIIHIHYNDLRLEIPVNVYKKICSTLNKLEV